MVNTVTISVKEYDELHKMINAFKENKCIYHAVREETEYRNGKGTPYRHSKAIYGDEAIIDIINDAMKSERQKIRIEFENKYRYHTTTWRGEKLYVKYEE